MGYKKIRLAADHCFICSKCQRTKISSLWWATPTEQICNACYSSLCQSAQGKKPGEQPAVSTQDQEIRAEINRQVRALPLPVKGSASYEADKTLRGDLRARLLRKFGLAKHAERRVGT